MSDYYERKAARRDENASAVVICIAAIAVLVLLGVMFQ